MSELETYKQVAVVVGSVSIIVSVYFLIKMYLDGEMTMHRIRMIKHGIKRKKKNDLGKNPTIRK